MWWSTCLHIMIAMECVIQMTCAVDSTSNVTIATILKKMFKDYDKTLPPKHDRVGFDKQVTVAINVFIHSMFSLSETNMEYSMSMFLRERWIDDRLQFHNTINLTRLELDRSYFDSLWMPDLYILNEKESSYHEVTVPNKMLHIYPDGTVQYSAKVTGTFSCLLLLHMYPFDTQSCHLEVESYGHSTENMKFIWSSDPVSVSPDIQFPQFALKTVTDFNCERSYYGIVFPCIGVTFILERKYAYYILQIYLPSVLTVILSWVNFWLDCNAVPARITVGLLTVLTMTTQSAGARANLPRVSYIKAIDVYMATCLTFVVIGLLEFAVVNVLTRVDSRKMPNAKSDKPRGDKQRDTIVANDNKYSSVQYNSDQAGKGLRRFGFVCFKSVLNDEKSGIRPSTVDKISRIMFPVAFVLFNGIYWIYYCFLYNTAVDNIV